jgi:hypothetical protein
MRRKRRRKRRRKERESMEGKMEKAPGILGIAHRVPTAAREVPGRP